MQTKNNPTIYLFLILAMLFWGLSFIWYKQALVFFNPIGIVFFRLIISFPLLLVFALIVKRLNKISWRDIPRFFLLALFEPFLYFLGESYGMLYVSATVASIIIATIPLVTIFTAYIFFKEKLHLNNYIGILFSSVGVAGVVLSDSENMMATIKGLLLMFVAVFATQGYSVMLKKLSTRYSAITIVAVQNIIGSIMFLPFFLIYEAGEVELFQLSFKALQPLLFLAVFASTFALIFFTQGVRELGLSRAIVFTNFIPVFTAIFSYFILNENFNTMKISSILIVVFGLIVSQATGLPRIRIFGRVK